MDIGLLGRQRPDQDKVSWCGGHVTGPSEWHCIDSTLLETEMTALRTRILLLAVKHDLSERAQKTERKRTKHLILNLFIVSKLSLDID